MSINPKKALELIFKAGLKAVDPEIAVRSHVRKEKNILFVGDRTYHLDRFKRILLVGAGKGTAPMAKAMEDILRDRLTEGYIIVKYGHGIPLKKTQVNEAGHPVPDRAGIVAAEQFLNLISGCGEDDLIICIFSGGGSALLPAPAKGIDLDQKQETTRSLLECGATIDEINVIRKHLSRSKGGWLAKIAYPANVISLMLSDVVGDRLDVIASGPTVPDESTYRDCIDIINKYDLYGRLPINVMEYFKQGMAGDISETPKTGDPVFSKVQNLIVGNNRMALMAARDQAVLLGYSTMIMSSQIEGEAREVAHVFAAVGKEICQSGLPLISPACILAGGETTVTIQGKGKGGRNQELALSAAIALDGWKKVSLVSAGTDGTDGPTDAAGAIIDGATFQEAKELNLKPYDFLSANDSYSFFELTGCLLKTGPTRTNVMDLICLLVEE